LRPARCIEASGDHGDADLVASESSMTVPKMMLASAWRLPAPMSGLIDLEEAEVAAAAIDISTPWALPSTLEQGRVDRDLRGLERTPSPRAAPMPISAVPAPLMMPLSRRSRR